MSNKSSLIFISKRSGSMTNAKWLITKREIYVGETFAHSDISLEFAENVNSKVHSCLYYPSLFKRIKLLVILYKDINSDL